MLSCGFLTIDIVEYISYVCHTQTQSRSWCKTLEYSNQMFLQQSVDCQHYSKQFRNNEICKDDILLKFYYGHMICTYYLRQILFVYFY